MLFEQEVNWTGVETEWERERYTLVLTMSDRDFTEFQDFGSVEVDVSNNSGTEIHVWDEEVNSEELRSLPLEVEDKTYVFRTVIFDENEEVLETESTIFQIP